MVAGMSQMGLNVASSSHDAFTSVHAIPTGRQRYLLLMAPGILAPNSCLRRLLVITFGLLIRYA
jgi:hypothetical protein